MTHVNVMWGFVFTGVDKSMGIRGQNVHGWLLISAPGKRRPSHTHVWLGTEEEGHDHDRSGELACATADPSVSSFL